MNDDSELISKLTENQRRILIRRRDGRPFTPTDKEIGSLASLKRKGLVVRTWDGGCRSLNALVQYELTPTGCAIGHQLVGDTQPKEFVIDEKMKHLIDSCRQGKDPFHVHPNPRKGHKKQ